MSVAAQIVARIQELSAEFKAESNETYAAVLAGVAEVIHMEFVENEPAAEEKPS